MSVGDIDIGVNAGEGDVASSLALLPIGIGMNVGLLRASMFLAAQRKKQNNETRENENAIIYNTTMTEDNNANVATLVSSRVCLEGLGII